MIQTDKQFQEDYKNWQLDSEMKEYIQTFIPDNMIIKEETLDILCYLVTEYIKELTKSVQYVQSFETRHDNDAFNVKMVLKHESHDIEKKVKKNYFINTTLLNQR